MLRLAFDFIIAWREIRARPNAYGNKKIIAMNAKQHNKQLNKSSKANAT